MKIINKYWLAIARESLIRSGATASESDDAIEYLTNNRANLVDKQKMWAFEFCSQLESDNSMLDTLET